VLGRPSRPKDRTQSTKLEITFGHAFDRREVSSSKSAMRAGVPSVFDQPSRRAVLEVSSGVGRQEGALRDHPFFPSRRNASKTPCASRDPVPLAGQLLRHLRVEQARRLLVGNCERAVAGWYFKPAHCWIVPDTAASSGASRVGLDERRRIVDSPCDPRTYFSAAAACGPQHFVCAPSRWATAIGHDCA
jgi:hypothetical protein